MGTRFSTLCAESGVPGLSHIFNVKGLRRTIWAIVFLVFVGLTIRDLTDMIKDYIQFPVTVSVRVADSRVLPFPAVTVCNLNAVHRGRFCSNTKVKKPENVAKILCANLGDLLDSCEVSKMLDELLNKGQEYCGISEPSPSPPPKRGNSRDTPKPSPKSQLKGDSTVPPKVNPTRRRGKRQVRLPDVIKTVRDIATGLRGTSKGAGITGIINGIQDTLKSFTEGGGPLDAIVTQVANIAGFNVSSMTEIVPSMFMKAFTEVTGCRLGSGNSKSAIPEKLQLTLGNLTKTFTTGSCILKLPKLIGLFQDMTKRMTTAISKCTSPWVDQLSGSIKKGETPWFILLDLLSSWLAELALANPSEANRIGHQSKDLIQQCYFAGRECSGIEDFSNFFYTSYGNCFTYNLQIGNLTVNRHAAALSGFTGPKFGLELSLNLETDQYMPTSREAGAKVIVHDHAIRADPDQDAVHVPPGLVTYVGVKMINISRLEAPYPDKCNDDWSDAQLKGWAKELNYETYSSQLCLKLCLQRYTIDLCNCWLASSPSPKTEVHQCNTRKNKTQESCTEMIRQMYYNRTINCNCPPRCGERIFEKFVSTGKELPQCSALSSPNSEQSSPEDKENFAKVVVYFQSLSYQEINQDPKYSLTALLGAIGGILGVYLGFSFIAIFELIEVISRGVMCNSNEEKSAVNTHGQRDKKSPSESTKVFTTNDKPKIKKAF